MIRLKKIQAGAIQYVLVISVIIMIVLFAFISLVFLQNRLQLKSELYKVAIQNTYAGFDYLSVKDIPYNTPMEIQFSDFEYEETKIEKKHWGVFDLAIVQSQLKNESSIKIGLLGNYDENRKALYLQENNQPLVVVGNTRITGDVTLPKRGVKTGNIAGNSYYGSELVYGEIQRNSGRLPRVKNLDHIKQLMRDIPFQDIKSLSLEKGIEIHQSFAKETLSFETPLSLQLENMNLSGNIIIKSKKEIRITSSTSLNDVILIAPKIMVEPNFKGSFQGFASQEIVVSKGVNLRYPSSLVLIGNASNIKENIQIKSDAQVKGVVMYLGEQRGYDPKIQISDKTNIIGEVYCNGNLELNGKVEGFVYTSNFATNQFGRTYINYIYNGEINSEVVSEKYAGLFVGNIKPTVAKWMD